MSSAEDIEIWDNAVNTYESGLMKDSIEMFLSMGTISSKISYNIGCAHLTLNDTANALKNFKCAVEKDCHLAIGYFMTGICRYKLGSLKNAFDDFEATIRCMRGNKMVDYKQIGMKYQLHEYEVLLNGAAMMSKLGDKDKAKSILLKYIQANEGEKSQEKIQKSLDMLQRGHDINCSIPGIAVFKPPAHAVKNLKKKDYLGKAKVLYSADPTDKDAGFSGLKLLQETRTELLSDIRKPTHRQSLKRISPPARPPHVSMTLGRVVDRAPPRKPLPQSPQQPEDLKYRSETWSGKPSKPLPKCPVPVRPPNSPSLGSELNRKAWTGQPSITSAFEQNSSHPIVAEPNRTPLRRPNKPLPVSPVTKPERRDFTDNAKNGHHAIDVELEFNFSTKIKLNEDMSLNDVVKLCKQSIPRDVSVHYVDGLGRQKVLNAAALDHIQQGSIEKPKLICHPS
eukprot:gene16250-17891_t